MNIIKSEAKKLSNSPPSQHNSGVGHQSSILDPRSSILAYQSSMINDQIVGNPDHQIVGNSDHQIVGNSDAARVPPPPSLSDSFIAAAVLDRKGAISSVKRKLSRRRRWFSRWSAIKKSYLSYLEERATLSEEKTAVGVLENSSSDSLLCNIIYPASERDSQDSASRRDICPLDENTWFADRLKKVKKSGKFWVLEEKIAPPDYKNCHSLGEDSEGGDSDRRMRLVGGGDRKLSPIEGAYYHDTLARETRQLADDLIKTLDYKQFLDSYGDKWVLTIPKELSACLDKLLDSDPALWKSRMTELFNAGYGLLRQAYQVEGEIAAVSSVEYSGESAPWVPHYHLNFYVLPVVRAPGGQWLPLKRWLDKEVIEGVRKSWRQEVEGIFDVELDEINVWRQYFKKGDEERGKVRHWIQYMHRHPLEDLWSGWIDYKDGMLTYSYRKRVDGVYESRTVQISRSEFDQVFDRIRAIPKNFVRVRWFGFLSNCKRRRCLEALGFEFLPSSRFAAKWQEQGVYSVVCQGRSVWTFQKANDATVKVVIPVSQLNFSPTETRTRHKVWVSPKGLSPVICEALRQGQRFSRGSPARSPSIATVEDKKDKVIAGCRSLLLPGGDS